MMETDVAGARSRFQQSRLSTIAVMAVTAVVILAVAFISNQPKSSTAAGAVTSVTVSGGASGAAPAVGQPAPDFAATTADGRTVKLSDFRGHPVWLTFGASWCQPCRAENPDVEASYEKHKSGGLVVLQVFLSEDTGTVNDYAKRVGLTYVLAPDPDTTIASEYRILGIPSHFFIGADGVLRKMRIGALDAPAMEAAVVEIGG